MKFPCDECQSKTELHTCRHTCQQYKDFGEIQRERKRVIKEVTRKESDLKGFFASVRSEGIKNQRRLSKKGKNRICKYNDRK